MEIDECIECRILVEKLLKDPWGEPIASDVVDGVIEAFHEKHTAIDTLIKMLEQVKIHGS